MERKHKHAARDWRWQNVFPARGLSIDPRTGLRRRHHLDEATINKAIKTAVQRVGLTKRASSHTFRHSFATAALHSQLEHGPGSDVSDPSDLNQAPWIDLGGPVFATGRSEVRTDPRPTSICRYYRVVRQF